MPASDSFFKIKSNIFLDTMIQKRFSDTVKINNFRGDLTDISAKKEALVPAVATASVIIVYIVRGLSRCTVSETQNVIFSCTLYLAAKDFVRNVSAANPSHVLSLTLDKRRTDPADVHFTTCRMNEHSLYRDL